MATHVESGPPSAARPTGTIAFLFSDIEGSTWRWDAHGEAMARAVALHDALMRCALEAHGAYVFKTVGDEFCAAFPSVLDAVLAALDAQRSIARADFSEVEGLRVRMAVHAGTADERDGDYFGPAVNRVARLVAIGHGAQVLISGSALDLLQGELPPESALLDLGTHRLKDLARPERVYQLLAPDLPQNFPPLRSLDELRNNLPRQLTSFVGREGVVAEVASLLEISSLVTIAGAGGAGKTRCAIQIGAELSDGRRDGVWLAELAPISDPALVASTIAQALNVEVPGNAPILDALITYLKRKRLLLIIDNCEHLIGEVRVVAAAILRTCPDVRVLATSREDLNIAGERVYRLPSLAIPDAVRLFADRAAAADSRFALTGENEPYVADICRRLDGIPLAIELAAARVKMLSPAQLAQRLDERFRLLTGGDRSELPRHRTMRALIDWSYDLLSVGERAVFRRMSVFAGSFTLECAAAVCCDCVPDEIAALDVLTALVDKSLVQMQTAPPDARYVLLESTRQYARERLTEAGEYGAATSAHAVAYTHLAEDLELRWERTPDRAWIAQAEPELDNFRAALVWALRDGGDIRLGQRLAAALTHVWRHLGVAQGHRWVRAARECVDGDTPPETIAALDLADSELTGMLLQYPSSVAPAERARKRYEELGDAFGISGAHLAMAHAFVYMGKLSEAETLLAQVLAEAPEASRRKSEALGTLADVRAAGGDILEALNCYRDAVAMARECGADRLAASIMGNLGEAHFRAGDAAAALELSDEVLAFHRAGDDTRRIATTLSNRAAYLVALEAYEKARSAAREAVSLARDAGCDVVAAFALQHLAAVATFCAQRDRAARVLGYVDARLQALNALREYSEQQEYDGILDVLRAALGARSLSELLSEGGRWNEDRVVAEVMAD